MRDLRNLPDPLMSRLAVQFGDDKPGADTRSGVDLLRGSDLVEARHLQAPEVRRNDDGTATIDGYATVYDHGYDVAGGPPWGWTEIMARGAATKSLLERDPVVFLSNHDSGTAWGLPLASTAARSLELESDDTGLRISTTIDPSANALFGFVVERIESGHADAMSLAFRVLRQEWNEDYTERTIKEIRLYDVSVVTYPANPATVIQVRQDRVAEHEAGPPLETFIAQADALRFRL